MLTPGFPSLQDCISFHSQSAWDGPWPTFQQLCSHSDLGNSGQGEMKGGKSRSGWKLLQ